MKVTIRKLTGIEEARRAIETTSMKLKESKATLEQIYLWMHTPIRTQIFEIYLENIPSFVMGHLVRHTAQHPQPFVESHRDDRGGSEEDDRWTPVNMRIFANAEAIIEMAGQRLCTKSHKETRKVMNLLLIEMHKVDPDLMFNMVPNCVLQGGYCREPKICGVYPGVKRYNAQEIWQNIRKQGDKDGTKET